MILLEDLAVETAYEAGIDSQVFRAIIAVESAWNPWAVRYEPKWQYFYFPREWASKLNLSVETETACQQISWGLGQVMGSVARELEFSGNLTELCDPAKGLMYSALQFKKLKIRYGKTEMDTVAAYNAGSPRRTPGGLYVNQGYVDKVHAQLLKIRALV